MSEILQYIPGNSPLHTINPVTKLLLVILIVGLCVMSSQIPFLCFLIGVLIFGALFSGLIREIISQIPFLLLLSFFLVVLTSLTVQEGALLLPILPSTDPSIQGFGITMGGLMFGIILSLRFIVMITAFQLFVITTKPSDLVTGLLAFRLPVDYVLMLLIALRFIPSLQLEARRIHEAQLCRGYNPGTGISGKIRSMKPIMIPLVANSLAKTQVLGLTLDMRGYRARKKLPFHKLVFGPGDMISAILILIILGAFLYLHFFMA
ncbi:MAG TPA: energy-coupling factor transporter transmembrane component T [Methanospirillum sp.]|uniref:energy-coupling factor transporter transmembrane component T family protein n=1 Tax=Methanospirillum sp. TaxID=45200 RepID=UPI002BF4A83E|nr:energy-coupling factor transporter transmembrane component T [Methanospirillum sp.]HOJ97141.1 energy-coupling factor transporter transmembrane component T [Methanospirillum sp.]HOL40548.1 energy-coupling factor transporter transmembrane component T [Methanospirillum sp.]HPP78311.1 energy-coupling factor transporter transmembrane component T [Methanospirillum sp.]